MAGKIIGFIFSFLCLSVFATAGTIFVPDDCQTIQEAVEKAKKGDVIIVKPGEYVENIRVDKDYITIRSVAGAKNTFVRAKSTGHHIFVITGKYVIISGFTLINTSQEIGNKLSAGVCLQTASFNVISENIFLGNGYGILLIDSRNNILKDNKLSENKYGIFFAYLNSSNRKNIIRDNLIFNNSQDGICMLRSWNSMVENNRIFDNEGDAILLKGKGGNNIIKNNLVKNNEGRGISIDSETQNNLVYLNNFVDNKESSCGNYYSRFYSGSKIKYVFRGKTFINYLGNYWSDYIFLDNDQDGVGDIPYNLINSQDSYPLMEAFESYAILK